MSAAFYPSTQLRGLVWNDANHDGEQREGEFGVMDFRVELLDNNLRHVETTHTDEWGRFRFPGVDPGSYYVQYHPGPGIMLGGPQRSGPYLVKAGNSTEFPPAGIYSLTGTQSIEGTVWHDLNANGIQEPHEPDRGAGWRVTLQNIKFSELMSTETDENGHYRFDGQVARAGPVCCELY